VPEAGDGSTGMRNTKEHEDIFWSDENNLDLAFSDNCTGIHMYQN
jgi:hypothetical protein